MTKPFQRLRRFLAELKRRNVYQVVATYAVVGFVLIQVADLTFVRLDLPSWTVTLVIVLVATGFPLALVLAWAFERTPEGMRRTSDADPKQEAEGGRAAAEAGTGTAYKVLVGLGLVAAAVAGGWYLTGGGGESPEMTEGTVAVLPFEVSGSGTQDLRDGMVSLLSTGLDGAAGLRAISDRTVFATWEQSGPGETGATTEQALAVARQVGARYGVVGTAAGVGSELQLSAAAYETTSGDRFGQVEVSGSADSVTALAGQLTRRVLGLLAERTGEGLRAADLASVTTHSDTALRAFLSGERHRRAGGSGVEYYEAAIRADSSFALPYARLAFIGLWHGDFSGQYMQGAQELSDQLPERQRRLVRALYLGRVERRTLAAADSLRRLTEDYPDDPMIWESLGEFVNHENIPRGLPEVERALGRAAELDPGHAAYYPHYVPASFTLHHDSALVADRVESVPNVQRRRVYRLAQNVIFGDSVRRQRALSAYDTVSIPAVWVVNSPFGLQALDLQETVLRRVMNRDDVDREPWALRLSGNHLRRGRIGKFLADLPEEAPDGDAMSCFLSSFLVPRHAGWVTVG